jgi:tetratricopeptide (TPR) repeat protein
VHIGPALAVALLLEPLPLANTTGSAGSNTGLAAAAAASGRPRECLSSSRRALARGPSIWELARQPNLQKYCDLVARAQAQLATRPEAAKEAALEADRVMPGRAPPFVIIGRAELAMGAADSALGSFEKARELDPRSVEEPGTMRDYGRVLVKAKRRDQALAVYRSLVPRIDLLGSSTARISVLLEAAHVSMDTAGAKGQAALRGAGFDEAIAYLREARQRPPTQLSGDVLLSLVLVLDRAGLREQADAAAGDAARTGARAHAGTPDYLAVPEDKHALDALASEPFDRAAAQKSWEAFLAGAGGKGPFAAAARTRLDAVRRGVSRAPPRPKKGAP